MASVIIDIHFTEKQNIPFKDNSKQPPTDTCLVIFGIQRDCLNSLSTKYNKINKLKIVSYQQTILFVIYLFLQTVWIQVRPNYMSLYGKNP